MTTRNPTDAHEVLVHGLKPRSRVNGPGCRFVIWFQGCTLACPGCFNPQTHAGGTASDTRLNVRTLIDDIVAEEQAGAISGVTLSGGEPLQQPDAALELVRAIRAHTSLSVVVFSGYTIEEIAAMDIGDQFLRHIDVLIDGRYRSDERLATGLRGSDNQRIHLLSSRYTIADIDAVPEAEVQIQADGTIVLTGVAPVPIKRRQKSSS